MWWAVVCIFTSYFYQDLALLEESNHVFNDYNNDDYKITSINPDLDFQTGYATPVTKTNHNNDSRKRRKQDMEYIELKENKDIDINHILNEYGSTLKPTTNTAISKESNDIKMLLNKYTTPKTATNTGGNYITAVTPTTSNALNDYSNDNSYLTYMTRNYYVTDKAGILTITKEDLASSDSSTNYHMNRSKKSKITWQMDTYGTVSKYTSTQNDDYFKSTSKDNGNSKNVFTQFQEVDSETEYMFTQITLAKTVSPENKPAMFTEETSSAGKSEETSSQTPTTTTETGTSEMSTESTFVIPKAVTVSGVPTKTSGALRRRKPTTVTTTTEAEKTTITLDFKDKHFDIKRLLELFDYVVADDVNYFNLSQKFNETLLKYEIPTCPTTPTPTPPTPPSTINYDEAHVVAKCFVCGLEVEGIPYTSACADAFSGDFIPLVPVDPKARGQIAKFRKYCRYLDANRVITKDDEPHSLFGRFTGGCSVRWVDLTGVYTQRTCRNRRRAVMGKHFASKRMAKLEMALNDVENGCMISPMATLLPVSRGISLYARFHACVCTGSWCNRAVVTKNWMWNTVIMLAVVINVS